MIKASYEWIFVAIFLLAFVIVIALTDKSN